MNKPWPFDQNPATLVFTQKSILAGDRPILFVKLDKEDHAWQFLTGKRLDEEEPAMVALKEIYEMDPSIDELAKLTPGTSAYRGTADGPWAIFKL